MLGNATIVATTARSALSSHCISGITSCLHACLLARLRKTSTKTKFSCACGERARNRSTGAPGTTTCHELFCRSGRNGIALHIIIMDTITNN